jgi:peptidoglycan/LPS O-acetylase OafA/YrhL
MIGFTRLALALYIMAIHLGPQGDHYGGAITVLGFYILAGYFATLSMNGPYKGNPRAFLISRWLRLWPVYLAVFAITSWGLLLGMGTMGRMSLVQGWGVVAQVLMIVPFWPAPAVAPVGWMLKWLMLGYVAIAGGAARSPLWSGVWLLASVLAGQYAALAQDWGTYYSGVGFASQGFALGAVLYWLEVRVPRDGRRAAMAGALSYPVFLSHYAIGAAIPLDTGWPLFFAALPPTLALSWLIVLWVEHPISQYRYNCFKKER